MNNYHAEIIKTPSHKYIFVGSDLNVNLCYCYADNNYLLLSDIDAENLAGICTPLLYMKKHGIKTRVFDTEKEALEFHGNLFFLLALLACLERVK